MKTFLLMLALSAGWLAAQDRMADTLRKAVVEEESQHNLTAAVADYQAVVAQFDEGRKTAATALFRLAECYRKQGKGEQAKPAYQRVVQEFADQGKVAEQSRTVLATVYKVAAPKASAAQTVTGEQAAAERVARQHYRVLLLQEINLVNKQIERQDAQFALGATDGHERLPLQQQKLKLERELAALDMGIVPADLKGGR